METEHDHTTCWMHTETRSRSCSLRSRRYRVYFESRWQRWITVELWFNRWDSELIFLCYYCTGACNGDSGGPLVDQQGLCVGIASWVAGGGCARGYPDVFAKLWTAIPFYRQVTQNTIPNLPRGPQWMGYNLWSSFNIRQSYFVQSTFARIKMIRIRFWCFIYVFTWNRIENEIIIIRRNKNQSNGKCPIMEWLMYFIEPLLGKYDLKTSTIYSVIANKAMMEGLKLVFGSLACVLLASALAVDVVGDNYIVGGRNANRHQFPWIVSLRNTMNRHHCGGFILSDRWVGSAAHCTIRRLANPNNLIIASGAHTQTDGRKHRVARIVNHPRYNQEHVTFDFSIIQTVDRIPITPQGPVRAIRFPTGPVVHDGSTVFIAGWGWSRVRHITRTLFFSFEIHNIFCIFADRIDFRGYRTLSGCIAMENNTHHSTRWMHTESWCTSRSYGSPRNGLYSESSWQRYDYYWGRSHYMLTEQWLIMFLCIVGACQRDSGSPLVDQRGICIGIASWIPAGCGVGLPDVYAKLWVAIPFYRQVSQNTIPNLPQGPRRMYIAQ